MLQWLPWAVNRQNKKWGKKVSPSKGREPSSRACKETEYILAVSCGQTDEDVEDIDPGPKPLSIYTPTALFRVFQLTGIFILYAQNCSYWLVRICLNCILCSELLVSIKATYILCSTYLVQGHTIVLLLLSINITIVSTAESRNWKPSCCYQAHQQQVEGHTSRHGPSGLYSQGLLGSSGALDSSEPHLRVQSFTWSQFFALRPHYASVFMDHIVHRTPFWMLAP